MTDNKVWVEGVAIDRGVFLVGIAKVFELERGRLPTVEELLKLANNFLDLHNELNS